MNQRLTTCYGSSSHTHLTLYENVLRVYIYDFKFDSFVNELDEDAFQKLIKAVGARSDAELLSEGE